MTVEYAKELLAVDCQRILRTIEEIDRMDRDGNLLNEEEALAKNRLYAVAVAACSVFRHPEGGAE